MLNISKNQVVAGQPVVLVLEPNFDFAEIERKHQERKGQPYGKADKEYLSKWGIISDINYLKDKGLKHNQTVFLQKVTSTQVTFKDESGKEYAHWWSSFKNCATIPAGQENLGKDTVEYIITINGKKYKQKKFKDIGKVKASLLSMMDYHGLFSKESQKHLDTCPEFKGGLVSEWLEYSGDNLTRDDFSKVEVFEWVNKKIGKKADIDPLKFYDEQMFLLKVSSKYGSCVREVFKKVEDQQYIFVFVHEDYKINKYSWNYQDLKESEIIKKALKEAKIKGSVKATKSGKTAIAVKTATDAANIIYYLPEGLTYYTIDVNGNELAKVDNWFVLAESRDQRIAEIFED